MTNREGCLTQAHGDGGKVDVIVTKCENRGSLLHPARIERGDPR
jgi:hypothetical protein